MNRTYHQRIEAVKRYNSGEKPKAICKALNKGKSWFFFWINKYNPKDENWFKDQSKANKTVKNKTSKKTETLICNVRKKLSETKYSQIGILNIQWELKKLGVKKIPEPWTINRIIKRNNLIKRTKLFESRNKLYPSIEAVSPNILHEFDLIGPRYLGKGLDKRFYAFNIMDCLSNYYSTEVYPGKSDEYVIDFILNAWSLMGVPIYLQVDNEMSFKGSNRYPRTFGKLIKLCLYFGVEIIFIPESEPWRQGIIENFNNTWDKLFFRKQVFKDFYHLCRESKVFEKFHNKNHRYSKIGGKTPERAHKRSGVKIPPNLIKSLKKQIPFKNGKVSFIRLTNAKGEVRYFTEWFLVDKRLVHEYVKGTIFTKSNLLKFYYCNKLVKTVSYTTNKY